MSKLEVFDPQMCCESGICGSSADPVLVVFASDLEWLKEQGVSVFRHGLALNPPQFDKNELVKYILNEEGKKSLPIILFNGALASKGCYPSREKLAQICNVEFNDNEAPPIHREENCCCGVDCDCSVAKPPENCSYIPEGDCSKAAAEDNCMCSVESDYIPKETRNSKRIFHLIILVLIALLIAILIL